MAKIPEKATIKDRRNLQIKKVSVVIPARNEEKTVAAIVRAFKKSSYTDEIIVVDNASSDKTRQLALEAGARLIDCQLIGYGRAIKEGISHAQNNWIIKADADFEEPKSEWIDLLVKTAERDNALIVKPYWKPNERDPDRVTNFVAKPLLRKLFPELSVIKSPLSGIYLINRGILDISIMKDDFAFTIQVLVMAHQKGIKISQVSFDSIIHNDRNLKHFLSIGEQIMSYLIDTKYSVSNKA
jgi:glucosyl-3-phosphoglycerate synthase